ncbi:MAG: DNA polymerase III subunit gamma/tau [Oscillospiraceae bacterium]|nr:DNA polymerase III subunit gamma/tau [Oscillospiraceae bacterium]
MHLALYRKYRPRTFSEVISQPHITITLQNQIKSGNIAHAYLFTGSRGTGKTTCAKILSKAVNCLSPEKMGGNPCCECEACKSADSSPDIQEIDAASNNSVDDVRVLRDEAGYLPSELKYKVYIIDEVHMLSGSAFNALLKTLEEPPPHVIFILATTEIHKIPATVLSRCQRYEFSRINSEESAETLIKIAQSENITLEKDAALLIARLSDGGMRDALSLLDVAVSENDTVTQQIIRDCAGIAGKEHLFAIADAVANRDIKSVLTVTAGLYAKSKDPARLIDELIQHFRNLMILKIMPGDVSLLTVLNEEVPDYEKQSGLFSVQQIMNIMDKLEECLRLKGRKVETEICLMRLCVDSPTTVAANPQINAVNTPPPPPVQALPTPTPLSPPPPPPPSPTVAAIPTPPPVTPPPITADAPFTQWQEVLDKLDPFKAAMLEEAKTGISGNVVIIFGGATMRYFFENPDNSAILERAAREVTGKDMKVVFEQSESAAFEAVMTPPTVAKVPTAETAEAVPTVPTPAKVAKIDKFLDDVKSSGVQLVIQ